MSRLKNSLWIFAEKFISIIGLVFVTSYVAKYVGPSTFGVISLSMIVFQFVQSISMMGTDVTLLKRISENEKSGIKLLFSAFLLISIIYLVVSALIVVVMQHKLGETDKIFLFASAIACYFSSIDLINIYNEAKIKAKINVVCNLCGVILGLLLRFVITHQHLQVTYLSIPIVITTLIPFVLKLLYFHKTTRIKFKPSKKALKNYMAFTLSSGMAIIYSVIAVGIYTRLNQFSITFFMDVKFAGIFAVALTLSNAWSFIPNAILSSLYPGFFAEKNQESLIEKFVFLHLVTILISLLIIMFIYLFSGFGIELLYGKDYLLAEKPMLYLSFATMFGVLSSIVDRFVIKHGGQKYIIKKSSFVLAFCFLSSVILVPLYGMEGGALSVMLTELFSCTIMNYFFKNKIIYISQIKLFDLNYLKKIIKRNFHEERNK